MKLKLILSFILGLSCLILIAGTSNLDDLELTGWLLAPTEVRSSEFKLGAGTIRTDSLGRVVATIRNKTGAALVSGRVVALDTLEVDFSAYCLPQVTYVPTIPASEGGPGALYITFTGTPVNDSIYVYGTALTGLTATSTVVEIIECGTVASDIRLSSYMWTDIDSIYVDTTGATGVDSIECSWISSFGVAILATPVQATPFGVTITASVADNALGEVCIFGPVKVKSKTASGMYLKPGYPLVADAGGSVATIPIAGWGDPVDTTIVGFALGSKDDVSDTASIWMWFDPR